MRLIARFVACIALLLLSTTPLFAADPVKDKEASPSLGERITKDAVTGTLMKIDGEYFSIKDNDGKQVKLHVDKSTKLDKVVEGDKVKAYMTDKGHVTTLQRLEK
jgi:non-homologous end joining protein Ku